MMNDFTVELPVELSPAEENMYEAIVGLEMEKSQKEAACVRGDYESRKSRKMVDDYGIPLDTAMSIVRNRCDGKLLGEDRITLQNGETVTVNDIRADPAKYDKLPCCDLIEPELGSSKAMIYANVDDGKPIIHSFNHGGAIYHLSGGMDEPEPLAFEEALEMAAALEHGDTDGIKELLEKLTTYDAIDQEQILKVMKKKTGMTMGAMRDFLTAENEDYKDKKDHLDLARIVIEQIGGDNIISTVAGTYTWRKKGVWKMAEPVELKQRVQRVVEKETDVISSIINSVTDVLITETFQSDHKFNIGDPEVINTPSGELHLDKETFKWVLKPHNKQSFRTSQIPVAYDHQATAPKFAQFLTDIFEPDEDAPEKIKALMEMAGYSMVAHCHHEKFVILIGAGANGKSVLLSLLEALLGSENIAGVQPSQFDRSFQRAHLHNKLANIVTEIKQGEVMADAELKGIVSGEPSTVEHKFKNPFTMRPYATCWFATNHMPHTRDFSDALFRRALVIRFNRVFRDHEKKPRLKDQLLKELPGILNMALVAYAHALENGFTMPPSSEAARQEWRLEADQVQQFVLECCDCDGGKVPTSEIYNAYREWAADNGIKMQLTKRNFRDRLTRLNFGRGKSGSTRYVTGLTMKGIQWKENS